jgi:ABC-type Mn2+/Zn2+ transport system permease subunit
VHACLFANVVSYFLDMSQIASMMVVGSIFSIMVFLLKRYSNKNAVISVVSTTLLSSAIIFALYFQERTIFEAMLFGDILSIEWSTFYIIIGMLVTSLSLLKIFLNHIVIVSIDLDLAVVKKLPVEYIEFTILIIMALVIAVSINLMGAFLVSSLLIIPAIASQLLSNSPLRMLVIAAVIGLIAGMSGLCLSFNLDWPLSPSISISCVMIYIIITSYKWCISKA